MIIQRLDKCYEVIRKLSSTSRMAEFLCREQRLQEDYLLVRIAEPTLAKRFTLFLEEKISGTQFPDYRECFQWDGAFYAVFTYSSGQTLAGKLDTEDCPRQERAEIARRLLEQMLLRSPHPYFMRPALRTDMITVSDSLDVSWNYHMDEMRTFDYCTMEAVCQQLTEVIKPLFEEELSSKQHPLLENYLLALEDGKRPDYLELYREFMPVYEALCEEGTERLPQTHLQRLAQRCRKMGDKPDSLKGYLRFGKRYVAKKLVFCFGLCLALIVSLLLLFFLWVVYPWVESRFLTKTMVIYSQDMEGYTGKVRLVGDLEADNVIFVGTLTEGRLNGQGTLYDTEGNLRYQGEFLADQYSGIGDSYHPNGNVEYTGQFSGGQYEGTGKLYDEAGVLIYEGGFSLGLYEGSGTLYYSDGRIQYRGSFSQGLYDGAGTLFYKNGVVSYEGEFFQGKRSGSGKAYDVSGELLYDGTFSRDRYEGEGTLYKNSQIVCQGSFHRGVLISGVAVYYDGQGNPLYQGGISNGLYDGQGKLFSEGILIYEGGFSEGDYHGSGKEYQEETGRLLYDGMFEKGEYSGEGKLYDPACGYLIYEGGFREGQYDGQGISYAAGILAYEGEFLLGAYNGKGILYDQTTGAVVFEGVFYNGQPLYEPVCPEQEE